jgi:hypothetical protein
MPLARSDAQAIVTECKPLLLVFLNHLSEHDHIQWHTRSVGGSKQIIHFRIPAFIQ